MSVEELIGRLKVHEERLRGTANDGDHEQLLLTRAQWKAKEEKSGEASSSSIKRGGWRGRGRGSGRGRGRGRGDSERANEEKPKFDKKKVRCYNCQNHGHFSWECRSKKKEEKALAVEKEDNDPALLLAEMCELIRPLEQVVESVLFNEEKVRPRLHGGEGRDDRSWYLDTGASNHMTGSRDAFAELDMSVGGVVKFGDGSAMEIHGRGTVLFQDLGKEHKVITDVYYIPRLRSNIISLGQLEENGCKSVLGDGYLCIYDVDGRLLAKVQRGRNRLYVLNLEHTQPMCLMARYKEKEWLWHARYGHMNFRALREMSQSHMVEGLPTMPSSCVRHVWQASNIVPHSHNIHSTELKNHWSLYMLIFVVQSHQQHQQAKGISC